MLSGDTATIKEVSSLAHTARRAFQLVEPRDKRKLLTLSAGNIVVAALDAIGLLLLVPFLALLGQTGGDSSPAARISTFVIAHVNPNHALAIIAVTASFFFLAKSVLSVLLLWIQTGVLNNASSKLCDRILNAYLRSMD